MKSFSKRQWIMAIAGVVLVGAVVMGLRAGYLPEIGKFFAYDPGYVPVCAWHGEQLTPAVPVCCAKFVPVQVTRKGQLVPTLLGTPVQDTEKDPPEADLGTYCVVPGCQAVERQVQCIRAPCDPVIEIVCPPGVTPPPPRPSVTPPITGITVTQPQAGATLYIPGIYKITWATPSGYRFPPSSQVELTIYKRSLGSGGAFRMGKATLGDGIYRWDTSLPVTRLTDGTPQDLSLIPGNDFFIIIRISGEQESAASGDFTLYTGSPTPTITMTPPPISRIGLSIRPLSEDTAGLGAIPIRAGVETPIQLFVSSNNYELALTAAELHFQSSPQLRMTRFTPSDLREVLEPVQTGQTPDGQNTLSVTVGSGTTPISGYPIIGTVYVSATANASGFLDMNLMGDTQFTAAGYSGNVLGGFSPRRFIVAGNKPGDADGDGDVDIFDYNIIVSNFGRTGTGIPGDLDANGKVDIFDYNLVVSNFGT